MACVRKSRKKWVIDYRDANGKRHIEVVGDNKKEAERKLRTVLSLIDAGGYDPDGKKIRFKDYAEMWILERKADLSLGTWSTYNGLIKNYLLDPDYGFSKTKLASITRPAIVKFKANLIKNNEDLANRTINGILKLLGNILQSALMDGYITVNAARLVKKLPLKHHEMEILKPKEIRKVLEEARKSDWDLYVMVYLLVMTGMRRGEMLALDWKSINFADKALVIRRSYSRGHFQEPKTRNSRRAVNLTPSVIQVLKEHRLRKGNPDGDELLFDQGNGEPIGPPRVSKVLWPRLLKRAGIRESVRLHDLRHTYCSLLLSQGANPKYIQAQLGHSSIMITMDLYGHLMPETNKQETERLDVTVFGESKASGNKLETSA